MKLQLTQFLNAARIIAFFALATTSIVNAQLGTNRTLSVNPSATNQTAPTGNESPVTSNQGSIQPTISDDGTVVAYGSTGNLTTATDANPGVVTFLGPTVCTAPPTPCNLSSDLYVWKLATGNRLITHFSTNASSTSNNAASLGLLSPDGNFVHYVSHNFGNSDKTNAAFTPNITTNLEGSGVSKRLLYYPHRADVTGAGVVSNRSSMLSSATDWAIHIASGALNEAGTFPQSTSSDGRYIPLTTHAVTFSGLSITVPTSASGLVRAYNMIVRSDMSTTPPTSTLVSHRSGANTTGCVNKTFAGVNSVGGNIGSNLYPATSADGSKIVYVSTCGDIISGLLGDTAANQQQIYLWDAGTNSSVLVSHASGSTVTAGNNISQRPGISRDGRFVYYTSDATDLVSGVTNPAGSQQLIRYDVATGTNSMVSISTTAGTAGNATQTFIHDYSLHLNQFTTWDDRFVLFVSNASTLVAGDGNGVSDLFVRDMVTNTTTAVSVNTIGGVANAGGTIGSALSASGRIVNFSSTSTDHIASFVSNNGGLPHNFLRNRATGTNYLVSHATGSGTAGGNGSADAGALSSDGTVVAFSSTASNLDSAVTDANQVNDVFVHTATSKAGFYPGIASIRDGANTIIVNNANSPVFSSGATNFKVNFDWPVRFRLSNPLLSTNPDSSNYVDDPGNYLFVSRTDGAAFQTTSCTSGTGTDTVVAISAASYDQASYTTTLVTTPTVGNATYRLFVCATNRVTAANSIKDAANLQLDGNNDGTPGDDFNIFFRTHPVPIVSSATTIAGGLALTGSLNGNFTGATITFSTAMDSTLANNSANYQVIGAGPNTTLQTTACGALAGDDVAVPFSVSYSSNVTTVTLTGAAFPRGLHRLLICKANKSQGSQINLNATLNSNNQPDTGADSSFTFTIQGVDLGVAKTHVGNFIQGDVGKTYTVTPHNFGEVSSSGTITVTDTPPAGITITAMAGTNWTCNGPFPTTSASSCTSNTAIASATDGNPITVTVSVAANAASSVTNSASISGGNENPNDTGNNTANNPTTITTGVDLIVSKTHTGSFVKGSTGNHYTVTVTNSGTGDKAAATLVTMTETAPSGMTVTAMSGGGWTCNLATCTRSDVLLAGASYPTIDVTVSISLSATSPLSNGVAVTTASAETSTGNNSASDSTTLTAVDLGITKSHSGSFVQGSTGNSYTLTITNSGTATKPSPDVVTVTEVPPTGLTVTAMSGTNWTCTALPTCTRTDALAPSASYETITVTVSVAANAASSLINQATVATALDTGAGNNTANDTTTITTGVDLTVTKTHTGSFVKGSTGNTYTVTVTNAGTGTKPAANLVTLTETAPSGMTVTAMSGTNWTCSLTSCTRSDALVASASYEVITVTVSVALGATSPLVNAVAVTTAATEISTANNSANDSTTLTAVDLGITKSHVGNFTQGDTGKTYTLTVTNSGTAAKPSPDVVTVTDTAPAGLTITAMGGTGWTCTSLPTCTRTDALAPSASYPTILVTVNVAGNAGASVTNSASVATALDTGAGNNTANDLTTVNPGGATDVSGQVVVNTSGVEVYDRGIGRWKKTVTIQNTGAALSNAAIVLDSLAAGWTLTNGDGVTVAVAPLGSSYKIVGVIGAAQTVSVQLQFTKTGALPLTFTARVLEGAPR